MELGEKKYYIFFTLCSHVNKSKTQMAEKILHIEFIYNFQIISNFKWKTGAYFSVPNVLLCSFVT